MNPQDKIEQIQSETEVSKLWNKNLILLIIGQVVSLFGNEILRFALPLYILYLTDSAAMFGTVAAVSFLPMIIISPVGGILADRVNKKRIMVVLDFITAVLVFLYILASGFMSVIPITIVVLMGLFAIMGIMSPTIDSSIPIIVPKDQLVRGNAAFMLVNILSGMIGPAIGGILFAGFGIMPLLYVSGVSFALAATMEIFIKIPNTKQKVMGGIWKMVKSDMKESFRFLSKKNPVLLKMIVVIALVQLVATPMIFIGIPILITQYLGMGGDMFGFAKGAMGFGGLIGGILAGSLGPKLKVQNSHLLLMGAILCGVPLGLVFLIGVPVMVAYVTILISTALLMALAMIFSIQVLAYVQLQAPTEILGKVMALVTCLTMAAQPLGFLVYGFLFEELIHIPWVVIFTMVVLGVAVSGYSAKVFRGI